MMSFRSWCLNDFTWYGSLTLLLILRICCADDLTFTSDKYDGDYNITMMTGESFDVVCNSQSDEEVSWWHNGNEVPYTSKGEAVEQLVGPIGNCRLYFYAFACPQDSGNYICKSENEEKILKMSIVDPSLSTAGNRETTETTELDSFASFSGASDITPNSASDGTQENLTADVPITAIVVPLVLVFVFVIVGILLLFRRNSRRGRNSARMKSDRKSYTENYEIIDDFPENRREKNGIIMTARKTESSADQHNKNKVNYEVIDDFHTKSEEKNVGVILNATALESLESQHRTNHEGTAADYQSLNWTQSSEPCADDVYDRLHQQNGGNVKAIKVGEENVDKCPYAEIHDHNLDDKYSENSQNDRSSLDSRNSSGDSDESGMGNSEIPTYSKVRKNKKVEDLYTLPDKKTNESKFHEPVRRTKEQMNE